MKGPYAFKTVPQATSVNVQIEFPDSSQKSPLVEDASSWISA